MPRVKAEETPVRSRRTTKAEEAPAHRSRAKVEEAPARRSRTKGEPHAAEPARRSRSSKDVAGGVVKVEGQRRSRSTSGDSAPTSRSKRASVEAASDAFNPYSQLDDTLDAIEKHIGISESNMDKSEKRLSTGWLCQDIVLGGGITAGWYTNFGLEQCCKTTDAVAILIAALNSDVPVLGYWDYEGSASPDYIENMMRNMGVKADVRSIFGVRDEKTGKYLIAPRVRYKTEGVAEKFFDYVAKLQRILPDKKKIGDQWYYIYDGKTADGKIHKENVKKVGKHYDVNYFRKTGKFRIPAPDGTLQALILLDSYPAMLPEKQDVDDPNSAIGVQARMFSEQLKRVKGKMKAKRMAVIGINQLRLKPMVMMGNPEYETCGEALKLFCFGEDTLLFTKHGLVKAKEMQYLPLAKTLGEEGPEQPTIFSYMGHEQLTTVDTHLGFSMSGKSSHRIKVIQTGKHAFRPVWTKLSEISNAGSRQTFVPVKVGANFWPSAPCALDFSYDTRCNNEVVELTFPDAMSPDLAKLLGYWTSEGHIRDGHCIFTNFHDPEVMLDFADTFARVFGMGRRVARSYINGNEFRMYSMRLYQFLCYVGAGNKSAHEKDVPWTVRQSNRECVVSFLQSLFEGDGHIGRRGISYLSSSRALIDQTQLFLTNLGILTRSTLTKRKWNTVEREFHDISISGIDAVYFLEEVGFLSDRKLAKYSSLTAGRGESKMTRDVLPELTNTRMHKKMRAMLASAKGRCLHYRVAHFTDEWFCQCRAEISLYRTSSERNLANSTLNELQEFLRYTVDNGIVWTPVSKISRATESTATFDFNMPKTSTVVTNGIVSHNSDVRIKFTSRALSGVTKYIGEKVTGEGQIESEPSVLQRKGNDNYRYIHIRGHKNKLSRPYLETYLRLWITDPKGNAFGFDPVWDTFLYLKQTGQTSGKRNKLVIRFEKHEATKPLSWLDFKRLILSDRKTTKEIYESVGLKPFDLRAYCFKQMASGRGLELYNEYIANGGEKDELPTDEDLEGSDTESEED